MRSSSAEELASLILLIRRKRVILSSELAHLYQVEPRALIQAVKRNKERFPDGFMLQLTAPEFQALRSQSVILETGGKGAHPKYPPYGFTQEGIAMLSSVLRSPRTIHVNHNHYARFRKTGWIVIR